VVELLGRSFAEVLELALELAIRRRSVLSSARSSSVSRSLAWRTCWDPATCLSIYAHVVREFEGSRMDLTAEISRARDDARRAVEAG
jgi:hypothetical protein